MITHRSLYPAFVPFDHVCTGRHRRKCIRSCNRNPELPVVPVRHLVDKPSSALIKFFTLPDYKPHSV